MNLIGENILSKPLKELVHDMHQGINTVTEKVEYLNDGIPIIQSKHITKGFLHFEGARFLSLEDYEKYNIKYQPKVDDLLVCNIGTIGKSLRIDKENQFLIAWNLFLIKIKKEQLYSSFFAHFLNYLDYHKYFDRFLTGGTVKFINKKTMGNIPIPLPPLDQQKKIAAILDAADAYRQKTKALIEKYDELTQSLFMDMFGDETGSLTELGKIIKTVGGGTPSKDNEQYWNGNIPWASVKDLKSDRLNKTQDFITQAGVDNSATRVIPNGSLIVATRMAVGRAAICEMDVAINQDLKAIQLIGEINITYLLYLFKSKENYFDSVSSGATVKGIKIEHITKLKVNLPEIDLQNQFAERVQAIEAQKAQAQASLAGAEDLFNSLLQRAFKKRGELLIINDEWLIINNEFHFIINNYKLKSNYDEEK
tara:strand:+ start:180 stop:1448 length:1269 start_codon:yes stop_codon:yes gene_type:complete